MSTLIELQLLVNNVDNLTPGQLQELMDYYTFQSMINTSLINYDFSLLQIVLLEKLAKHDIFYQNLNAITHALSYLIYNLQALKDFHLQDILTLILKLLRVFLKKAAQFAHVTELFRKKREQIIDVLTTTINLKIFIINHVHDFTSIVRHLFLIDGCLQDSCSKNLAEIIKSLKKMEVIHEIASISETVILNCAVFSAAFKVCSLWILTEGVESLLKTNEEQTIFKLLQVINSLFMKYQSHDKQILQNDDLSEAIDYCLTALSRHSEMLISFLIKEDLRKDSLKLFSIVLTNHALPNDWDFCYKKLLRLPTDPSEWVNAEPEIFLRICYLLNLNNRVMWAPSKIIKVISSLVYSFQRFSLKLDLLKAICYIYPFVLPECITKINLILGDDILIIITRRLFDLNEIFSLHVSQLNWVLRRGEYILKKAILCYWLKNDGDEEILKKCINVCVAHDLLIGIVMDPDIDFQISFKASQMIKSLNNPYLSSKIAKMLPLVHNTPIIFNRLMISNPGIPDDPKMAMSICEFMSLALVLTVDEEILGLACDYSKSLIKHFKTNVDVVNVFCKNSKNILFLLMRLKKLKDETAVKVMGLLKDLLLVQKRNHTTTSSFIETDIQYAMIGSTVKLEKCLDILHLLTPQRLFIRLSPLSINPVFVRLLSLTRDATLADKCFVCLVEILRKNHWLATSSTTNHFVELQCSLSVCEKSSQEFVMFLLTWVKILKTRIATENHFYLAHTGIIHNYIKRIPNLPKKKMNYLVKSLNKIEAIKPHSTSALNFKLPF